MLGGRSEPQVARGPRSCGWCLRWGTVPFTSGESVSGPHCGDLPKPGGWLTWPALTQRTDRVGWCPGPLFMCGHCPTWARGPPPPTHGQVGRRAGGPRPWRQTQPPREPEGAGGTEKRSREALGGILQWAGGTSSDTLQRDSLWGLTGTDHSPH